MPTYEYQCQTCGATMDIFQSIKAAPLRKARCKHCNDQRPVRRLIGTGGAVIFKGAGFYQTDYRSEGYKSKAKAETESAASKSPDNGKEVKPKDTPPVDSDAAAKSPGKKRSAASPKD